MSSFIAIVGNMCMHLRKLQKQKYLIEAGTHNLIFILRYMSNLNFVMQAAVAIRKATACRITELLDAFVSNGLIETVHERLHKIGPKKMKEIEQKPDEERTAEEDKLREIQINCQCIIIQLCYRAQNINKLESLHAIEYIKSFEHMVFARRSLEETYI